MTTLALGGLYALWLGELLAGDRPAARPTGTRLAIPLLVYVEFSALSFLAASDTQLAQFKLLVLVQSLLLFIYVAGTVRTVRDVRFVVGALLVALLAQGLLVLGGRVAGLDLAFAILLRPSCSRDRRTPTSTVASPLECGTLEGTHQ